VKARRFGFVTASFVPPGDRLNPYPLGITASPNMGAGLPWKVKVVSAQTSGGDLIVKLQATNTAQQPDWTFALAYWMFVKTRTADEIGDAPPQCTPPSPDFFGVGSIVNPYGPGAVEPGQTVTGNVCFVVPQVLGTPKVLFVEPAPEWPPPDQIDPPYPPPYGSTWFALR
jgi:hypothetical protein